LFLLQFSRYREGRRREGKKRKGRERKRKGILNENYIFYSLNIISHYITMGDHAAPI